MPHNRDHDALRFAVTDYLWDRLEAEGVLANISDGFWDWYDETIEKPVLALICEVDGHDAVADQCNKPDHDYCAICNISMPGQAPRSTPPPGVTGGPA